MVMARLHVICGNCGCNDEWEFEIVPDGNDYGTHFTPAFHLWCRNCSTLHTMDEIDAKEIGRDEQGRRV